MKSMTLESLIKSLNLNLNENKEVGTTFDIADSKLYTDSYNEKEQKVEKKLIERIVYQGQKPIYELHTSDGTVVLEATPNHKLYDALTKEFVELDKVESLHVLSITDEAIEVFPVKTDRIEDCFDLTVADNHNYFSNGILSKNCTGGFSVNYFASTRFRVTMKEFITDHGEVVGIRMKIKNYKNKTGIMSRECLLDLYFKDGATYKRGIDGEGQYIDMLVELGIVNQHGAWFKYREGQPDEVSCQGMNGVKDWFAKNPEEWQKVKKLVDDRMSKHDDVLDANTGNSDEQSEIAQMKEEDAADAARKANENEASVLAAAAAADD